MSTDRDEAFLEIQKGDKVYYFNAQLQECSGKAVMVGPDGWVVSCENGPVVVNEGNNYAGHIPSKGEREDDHFGKWLNNWSTSI